jgi:hypothetical protein
MAFPINIGNTVKITYNTKKIASQALCRVKYDIYDKFFGKQKFAEKKCRFKPSKGDILTCFLRKKISYF